MTRKPKTIAELRKYVGKCVKVTFYDGDIKDGILGYTAAFNASYGYRKAGYFTIENLDFRLNHIKRIEVEK